MFSQGMPVQTNTCTKCFSKNVHMLCLSLHNCTRHNTWCCLHDETWTVLQCCHIGIYNTLGCCINDEQYTEYCIKTTAKVLIIRYVWPLYLDQSPHEEKVTRLEDYKVVCLQVSWLSDQVVRSTIHYRENVVYTTSQLPSFKEFFNICKVNAVSRVYK